MGLDNIIKLAFCIVPFVIMIWAMLGELLGGYMCTLWVIEADGDATFSEYKNLDEAIKAQDKAIRLYKNVDFSFIEIGNGEQVISRRNGKAYKGV